MRKIILRIARLLPHHITLIETVMVLVVIVVMPASQAYAVDVTRLLQRSLYIGTSQAGATTDYTISFRHNTISEVGSVDIRFCIDPIPYMPCDIPPGFDISQATFSVQTGETGYTDSVHTVNHIVLSRTPAMVGSQMNTYVFRGVKNPTYIAHSFSARLTTFASSDASGMQIDVGSVVNQATDAVMLETQVPPILIFCMAASVSKDCTDINGISYADMGPLTPDDTLLATSQMAVGTNATDGYVITVNGTTMQAGTKVIRPLNTPTSSVLGVPQFGLNLRANNAPFVGTDPDGDDPNAQPTANYNVPDKFMFKDGDIVATAPYVSYGQRFTVSYIVNSPADLRAGVYTTSITYICTGRF